MSTIPISDWNGPQGEAWSRHQAWLDGWLQPFGQAALKHAAPAPGERVLDIGCGAGATTVALAEAVGPQGLVVGEDISAPLIALARQRPGLPQMRFRLADATQSEPGEAAFDLLFSRLGVMFFADPADAFSRLRERLKPGGRLAFVCWRPAEENDWARLPLDALAAIAPYSSPPPETPGPFAFGDARRVSGVLAQAGFVDIRFQAMDHVIRFGRGETREAAVENALAMAFEVGPLARALKDKPDDVRERACDAVRAAFAERAGPTSVDIVGAAWIVTATSQDV